MGKNNKIVSKKNRSRRLRTAVAAAVIAVVTIGYFTTAGIGTISSPGIGSISLLCPMGALTTMLASKMLVPRAMVSLVIMLLLIVVFGRAFCGWVCPVPLVEKLRGAVARNEKQKRGNTGHGTDKQVTPDEGPTDMQAAEEAEEADAAQAAAIETQGRMPAEHATAAPSAADLSPLTASERAALAGSHTAERGSAPDVRHFVLGGALLSTFAFGFPVFCLVCPIGLTFASIFLVINLFATGDVTWSVVVVPLLLACEVLFFKKWCHKLCPLSAFMSLVGKLNRTFVPTVDSTKCLEDTRGTTCGACGRACNEGLDPRHPQLSQAAWSECTKCRACVDACPQAAISMPLLARKNPRRAETQETRTGADA